MSDTSKWEQLFKRQREQKHAPVKAWQSARVWTLVQAKKQEQTKDRNERILLTHKDI